jgi:ribose transport system substrate-binding protein
MNVVPVAAVLRLLAVLLLLLDVGCGRQAAARAQAQARWQAALARADAQAEVANAAQAAKAAEVAMHDARARLGRRDSDSLDAERERLYQDAAARAVQEHGVLRAAWQQLRVAKARASLSADELAQIERLLGHEIGGAAAPVPGGSGAAGTRPRIAVIPKGTTQVFWKSVEKGVRQAAAEAELDVVWKGPLTEDDRAQQVQLVQQFTSEGIAGIVLAPLDAQALLAPVRAARAKNIPVVIFDSALAGEAGKDFASFVATDNDAAGRVAGDVLAKFLRGSADRATGKVVMLRFQVGSASTQAREDGFLAAIAAHKDVEVTVSNRYGGATVGDVKTQALNLVDKLREAAGVFTCNEVTTHGMLLALQQEGLAGKVQFVGFDASPVLVAGLEAGSVQALIVQNPARMGREAVLQLAAVLRGEPATPRVDTGAMMVDKEALRRSEIQALLK